LGGLIVSKRDLQRIEVLTEILAGKRTAASAAGVLAVSVRQAQRLLSKYRDGGGGALIHKARGGRASNNQLGVGLRDYAVELVRPHGHRRKQKAWSRTRRGEGAAGPQALSKGDDEQREGRLQETRAQNLRASARAQRERT
jgi:hypothetical protein